MENDYYKRYEPFFGSWYIKRFIGKGSYGKVFEVERKDAFGTVYTGALKAITVPTSEDELEDLLANGMDRDSASTYFRNYAEGLNREIALMSRLKGHSNIVSYEDHDIQPHEDGMGWDMLIRMELLTPITIFQKANKPFTRRQVIQLGIDLCRALEVCQKYNIIHRDIKPANIFLSETGDFKLGDFGVARIASATTGASTRAGTVNYMAPEVFRGEKYTSNVDIYSLGLVMYQLLNANRMPLCPPYPQLMTPNQWEQANARRLSGAALPPPANADGRLAEIVLKACSPNSAERYEAPALMRQALEAILYTEQETKDIYPEGDNLPLPGTSEKNPPVPQPGTDRETENVWVKMREAGRESALEETSPETETLTEKVPTERGPELECEKVLETASNETENKTQFLFKAQEEARRKAEEEARKAEEARRAAEEAARQAEFERREQELARKREENRRKAEEKRQAERNDRKEEEAVPPVRKKSVHRLKYGWADIVGAAGIGIVLLIVVYNFLFAGMFMEQEEPASSEETIADSISGVASSIAAELPAAASTPESESASSEESASASIPESSSTSSSSEAASSSAVSSSSSTSSSSGAVSSSDMEAKSTSPSAAASDVAASGSCGPNAAWTLKKDGTLYIEGSGEVSPSSDYTSPWESYKVKDAKIAEGITSIGDRAFYNCTYLKSVTIPNSVKSIGNRSFSGCSALKAVTIPNSVKSMDAGAFSYCTSLTTVTISSGVTGISEKNFSGCTSLTAVTIPDSVTSIGNDAFSGCTSLTTITIPASVTRIGSSAFSSCVSLKSVTMTSAVESIGEHTFSRCTSLATVTLPEGIKSIGNNAFGECISLTSAVIPRSVTSIDYYAFTRCPLLTSVTISRNCQVKEHAFPDTTQINYYD